MNIRLICTSGLLLATASAPAATRVLQAFEGDGFGDWKVEGSAFGLAPVAGRMDGLTADLSGYSGESLACSAHGADAATGSLTSPEFRITENYIVFLIAGGRHPGKVGVELRVDGKQVLQATGENSLQCKAQVWDVSKFRGKMAQIRIFDEVTGSWGVIAADQFVMTDYANYKFPPSTRNGKAHTPGLVASDSIPGLTIPQGSRATVVADYGKDKVTSPTALAIGSKGEIYVTETHRFRHGVPDNRDHLYWYLDDIAARTVADRKAMHEKWKDKEEKSSIRFLTEKSDMVRLLAPPDAAGRTTNSQIYADGFNDLLDGPAAGVFEWDGTVYMACIPNIWALKDTNGDGKADEKKVLFDGFGVRVSFSGHDLNGFAIGPDGRIYGTLGDRGMSYTTREGRKYELPDQGCVFRFEPDGSEFEVIHTGLRNPKEIAFDDFGNAISVDNNSDQGDQARVVYVVDGGDSGWNMGHQAMHSFHRQIGMEQHPPNRWMDERMWAPENDAHPAYIVPPVANLTSGPSGLTYHPGAGFLEEEAGRFLICDYRGGAANSGIWSFEVAPAGAGMKMTDSRQMNWGAAVTDVEYTWDGQLMVTDFIGGWSSHENGRVYSLSAESMWKKEEALQVAELMKKGFDSRSTTELAKLMTHPDQRVRLRAQLALTRKEDGLAMLARASQAKDLKVRLHGVWGLGVIARRGAAMMPSDAKAPVFPAARRQQAKEALVKLLDDAEAEVRAQAARALGEAGLAVNGTDLTKLAGDSSLRVRFHALTAMARLKPQGVKEAVFKALAGNRDTYLRHAAAYALQSTQEAKDLAALKSHGDAQVRMAALVALRRQKSELAAEFLKDADAKVADEAIRSIHDESIEAAREKVAALLDEPVKPRANFMWRRLLNSAFRLGDEKNLDRVAGFAVNEAAPEEARLEALRLLSVWAKPHPVDQTLGHWAPLKERDAALVSKGLAARLDALLHLKGKLLEPALALVTEYKLDLSKVGDEALQALVNNASLPGAARSEALDLYADRKPAGLKDVLVKLAGDKNDDLAVGALKRLAALDPAAAIAPLREAVEKGSAARQQKAWPVAAGLKADGVAPIFVARLGQLAATKGVSPAALELLEAAETREEAEVKTAVAAYQKAAADSGDALAPYLGSLEGGDPVKGGQLFESHPAGQCMRCHAGGGHGGGEAGPDLSNASQRGDRRFLLESLVNPGAKVAMGYGIASVTLKGGKSVSGIVLADTPEYVELDASGKVLRVRRGDIDSMTPPVSAMPPMGALLQPRELRDIVAWLATRNGKVPEPKKRGEPEWVKP